MKSLLIANAFLLFSSSILADTTAQKEKLTEYNLDSEERLLQIKQIRTESCKQSTLTCGGENSRGNINLLSSDINIYECTKNKPNVVECHKTTRLLKKDWLVQFKKKAYKLNNKHYFLVTGVSENKTNDFVQVRKPKKKNSFVLRSELNAYCKDKFVTCIENIEKSSK